METEAFTAHGVVQEASTHSPSLIGAKPEIQDGGGRYPFVEPSTGYERAWWEEMRSQAQDGSPQRRADFAARIRRWTPLLKLMTPAERQAFHDQRRGIAARFTWDIDSARGDGERDDEERRLHDFWKSNLKGRNA
jgi:hypothetical protein